MKTRVIIVVSFLFYSTRIPRLIQFIYLVFFFNRSRSPRAPIVTRLN